MVDIPILIGTNLRFVGVSLVVMMWGVAQYAHRITGSFSTHLALDISKLFLSAASIVLLLISTCPLP